MKPYIIDVYFRPKMAMFDPCSCAPHSCITIPARYPMKLLMFPEDQVAIRQRTGGSVGWLLFREMGSGSTVGAMDRSDG